MASSCARSFGIGAERAWAAAEGLRCSALLTIRSLLSCEMKDMGQIFSFGIAYRFLLLAGCLPQDVSKNWYNAGLTGFGKFWQVLAASDRQPPYHSCHFRPARAQVRPFYKLMDESAHSRNFPW